MKDLGGCLLGIILMGVLYFFFHWVFRGAMLGSLYFDAYAPEFLKSIVYFVTALSGFGLIMILAALVVMMLVTHHFIFPIFWAFRIAFDPARMFVWMTIWSAVGGAFYAQSPGFQIIPPDQQQEIIIIWSRAVGMFGLVCMILSSLYAEAIGKVKKWL